MEEINSNFSPKYGELLNPCSECYPRLDRIASHLRGTELKAEGRNSD
jgi:hypothetical protein